MRGAVGARRIELRSAVHMPLEFRNLIGLSLLGLLVPLVVLYILKVRRKRLQVSSTWLWAAAARDLQARHPFRRLILSVPLVVQALALGALAVALSRPASRGGAIIGDHVAILVDTSASMTTLDADGTPRIHQAREAAHHIIDALGPGAEAILIDAGPTPRVVSPLDRDRRRLHDAASRIQAREARGALGAAVALASDRLRRLPGHRRVVVVTDGALADADALRQVALPLDVVRVGAPADNAAIVRVDVRRGTDSATGRPEVQAFALIANFGAAPRDLFVTLRPRNVPQALASRRLTVGAGERAPVVLTFEPAPSDAGMGLVVELSPHDAMEADDRAFGRVPLGRELPVVIAPQSASPWFVRALQADPDTQVLGSSLEELEAAEVPNDALVIIDGACPAQIPGADFVLLNPPPGECRGVIVGESVQGPSITSWNEADPRFRFLTLDGVHLGKAQRLSLDSPGNSLVRAQEGTVIADISPPGRTGTLVGFDVGESNWPLKASFVLFVRNLVEVTRTRRARGVSASARTGHPVQLRVPSDIQQITVQLPDGTDQKLPARGGLAVLPGAHQAGFHHVSWQGKRPGSVLLATNFVDAEESDLRPRELDTTGTERATVSEGQEMETFREWGWITALVALLLLVVDVWWLTRRPRSPSRGAGPRPRLPDRPREAAA